MGKFYWIIPASLLISGCQPTTGNLIHKTGSNMSERINAYDQCKIRSIRDIPQQIATQISPGYNNPGYVQCNSYGYSTTCNTVGAFNIPASSRVYDVNEDLRNRYIARCLADSGYSIIPRPICHDASMANQDPQPAADQIPCIATSPIR